MNRSLVPRSQAEADELLAELVAEGYVRTSRRFGHVSRIDRADWKDWAERTGNPIDPSFFRRVNTHDRIVLPVDLALRMPTHTDPPHYKPPRKHGRDRVEKLRRAEPIPCVDCGRPHEHDGLFYGAGDGTGSRFRCGPCFDAREIRRRFELYPSETVAPPGGAALLQSKPRPFAGLGKARIGRHPQCPECNDRHGAGTPCYGGFDPDTFGGNETDLF